MDKELVDNYKSTDYSSAEWARLSKIVADTKAAMDKATTKAEVEDLKAPCRKALAEEAVAIAAERIGTTLVCNTVQGMNNENDGVKNALTKKVTDDVTVSVEKGAANNDQVIYSVTITSAHQSDVKTVVENFVATLKK